MLTLVQAVQILHFILFHLQASLDSDKGINGVPTNSKVVLSYRCNFPTELCGRLIGKYGKNINYIKERSGANVALNTNPFTPAFQLCTVEGKVVNFFSL